MRLVWVKIPGAASALGGGTLIRARSDVQRPDGTACCFEISIDSRGAASLSGDLVEEISLYDDVDGARAHAQRIEDSNVVVLRGPDPSESITLCSCAIEQRGDKYFATLNTSAWSRCARQDSLQGAASWIAYWLGYVATGTTPPPPTSGEAPSAEPSATL